MKYTLKIKNKWMEKIKSGEKEFEYRLADKGFQDIDDLELIDEEGNSHLYKAHFMETKTFSDFINDYYDCLEYIYAMCKYYDYTDLIKYGVAVIRIEGEIKN